MNCRICVYVKILVDGVEDDKKYLHEVLIEVGLYSTVLLTGLRGHVTF